MSTLQLSLAIIGGLVLALIVAYNTWTSRRNAPKRALPPEAAEREHREPSVDLNLDPALRQEPGFDVGGVSATAAMPAGEFAALDRGLEPGAQAVEMPDLDDALQMPVPPATSERRPGLDALIDVLATVVPDHVISGDAALAAMPPTRRAGSKPFAIEGQNEQTQAWETPVAGQRYPRFQAGVQLANRTGALNEIEFSEFVAKVQGFADTINALVEIPDMLGEVARARELDQFASDHDAQLTFMLRAHHAAWSPGYVQQNAARQGFVAGVMPGRLVLPASVQGLPPLLTLVYDAQAALAEDPDQSAIRDISLSLDIPHVHRAELPFARLREVATLLCETMDGILCDQNGQPLPGMAMDPIAADLELLYDQLDAHELSAGSVLARRLFS
jgi:hypothetical protein